MKDTLDERAEAAWREAASELWFNRVRPLLWDHVTAWHKALWRARVERGCRNYYPANGTAPTSVGPCHNAAPCHCGHNP